MSKMTEEVELWLRNPVTRWFFKQIKDRYEHTNNEWRNASTIEDLFKLRGKVEVLDHIKHVLEFPDDYLPEQ